MVCYVYFSCWNNLFGNASSSGFYNFISFWGQLDGFWCGVNTVFVPGGTSVNTQSNSLIKVCFSLLKSHWISDNWRHRGLWPLTVMDFCAGTSESGLKTPLQQCKRIRRCWLYLSAKHANGAGTEWIITETTVDPPQAFTLNVLPESVSSDKGAPLGNGAGPWLVISGCSRCGCFVGLEGSQLTAECQSRAIRSSWIAMFLFSFPHMSLY